MHIIQDILNLTTSYCLRTLIPACIFHHLVMILRNDITLTETHITFIAQLLVLQYTEEQYVHVVLLLLLT